MSQIKIVRDAENDWCVWLGLEDIPPPGGNCLVIGCGETRDEAVADAVKDLEAALEQLQQPAWLER